MIFQKKKSLKSKQRLPLSDTWRQTVSPQPVFLWNATNSPTSRGENDQNQVWLNLCSRTWQIPLPQSSGPLPTCCVTAARKAVSKYVQTHQPEMDLRNNIVWKSNFSVQRPPPPQASLTPNRPPSEASLWVSRGPDYRSRKTPPKINPIKWIICHFNWGEWMTSYIRGFWLSLSDLMEGDLTVNTETNWMKWQN